LNVFEILNSSLLFHVQGIDKMHCLCVEPVQRSLEFVVELESSLFVCLGSSRRRSRRARGRGRGRSRWRRSRRAAAAAARGAARANVERHLSARRTTVGGVVIGGDQIGIGAVRVARSARGRRAVGIVGSDIEARSSKSRAGAHVDAREIPEDGVALKSVLVLQNVFLFGLHGHLDRDAAAVGVGAPVLRVGAAGIQGNHIVAGGVADGPEVDVLLHVVGDIDTAAITALDGVREGRSKAAKGSEESENSGELHCDCGLKFLVCLKEKNFGFSKKSFRECSVLSLC
jgi:hypothetical protein